MPIKRLESKISRVLVLYIVLFSSVVTLVLTTIQLRIDYNLGVYIIQQRIDQIKLTNLDSITQSLWTLDQSSIQIQLEGLSRIDDFIFVKINDENNELIAISGEITTENIITQHIKLQQVFREQIINLGTLTIVATKENIYQELVDTVVIILISQAIKTFLVSTFILIIFHYLVTRHLKKIARHSDKLQLTSKPEKLVIDRKKSKLQKNDELERVVNSINSMASSNFVAYRDLINNQKQLAEREAKFSSMFNAFSDAIIFANSKRQILQTNPSFSEQFGYGQNELIGQPTVVLYANPEAFKESGKKYFNPKTQPELTLYEIEYRRKDGSTFMSETMGGAIKLPDGSQLGFIAIIRDISARKQAEKEKIQLEKQLQQSQKMQAIGQLAGGVAHDFNNILSSILGYSELTKDRLQNSEDSKLIEYNNRITYAGERARDLVLQLLSYSRNEPGELQVLALPKIIDDIISIIRPSIPSSIKLMSDIDKNVPSVLMDLTQMNQLLMNLCINARDAIESHGTLTIKLEYEKNVKALCSSCKQNFLGDFVKITVEDTGAGIEENVIDSIFDPFCTTKEVGKGTGLGLSVVHGILHNNHAHILVETNISSGSKFHIMLPATDEDTNKRNMQSETKPDSTRDLAGNNERKHILVIDDEVFIVDFIQTLLQSHHYHVTTTTSSEQALELINHASTAFDLIITDQTMPEITGTELLPKIQKINLNIPVILCSGYNQQIDKNSALAMGFKKYLDKPFSNQTLLKAINEILRK